MTSNLLAALKSNQGKTSTTAVYPLIEAAKSGQVEGCSKALEDKKVKVDQKDPEGVNALMHAASGGYIQVVQFLVDKGARISAKDDMGETALMKACKEGHTDIIRFLVEAQAAQRKKGPSLTGGKDEAQQSLMREKKRILDMKDDEGVNLGCMKPILCSELVLLYYASAICLICCLARTAIMKAAEQGEGDVVQILADDGASLDLKDDEGWDVLMWASLSGHYEICELLVSNFGITADYATEKGETALMKAAANGHWDVCGFLIGEGAKVNQLDQHHQTALMWAASEGHLTTVQGLVKKDAKVDQVTKQGKTALLLAAQFGREEICKFLVAKGAKVEHQDEDGQTALFSAVQAGNPSLVKSLIELKCPTEAKTSRGETALIWAAMNQQLLCVQALLAHGANVHTTDENGQTAQDHAEGTLNSHVVEVLREAAKTQSKKDEE
ncbi:unnamed protein product [Durusdinium trenchii]